MPAHTQPPIGKVAAYMAAKPDFQEDGMELVSGSDVTERQDGETDGNQCKMGRIRDIKRFCVWESHAEPGFVQEAAAKDTAGAKD